MVAAPAKLAPAVAPVTRGDTGLFGGGSGCAVTRVKPFEDL